MAIKIVMIYKQVHVHRPASLESLRTVHGTMRDNSTVKPELGQAFSSLLKIWEQYQNYRRQKGDMKHVPH